MNDIQTDPTEMDFDRLMRQTLAAIPPEKISGIQAVIQLIALGESPQEWIWTIREGTCTSQRGHAVNPSLIIEATTQDWLKIISGKLSPMAAVALGRLQVSGNMQLAMSMANFFRRHPDLTEPGQLESTG